jgi:hypothetical protein
MTVLEDFDAMLSDIQTCVDSLQRGGTETKSVQSAASRLHDFALNLQEYHGVDRNAQELVWIHTYADQYPMHIRKLVEGADLLKQAQERSQEGVILKDHSMALKESALSKNTWGSSNDPRAIEELMRKAEEQERDGNRMIEEGRTKAYQAQQLITEGCREVNWLLKDEAIEKIRGFLQALDEQPAEAT